jgi:hypothetical protein
MKTANYKIILISTAFLLGAFGGYTLINTKFMGMEADIYIPVDFDASSIQAELNLFKTKAQLKGIKRELEKEKLDISLTAINVIVHSMVYSPKTNYVYVKTPYFSGISPNEFKLIVEVLLNKLKNQRNNSLNFNVENLKNYEKLLLVLKNKLNVEKNNLNSNDLIEISKIENQIFLLKNKINIAFNEDLELTNKSDSGFIEKIIYALKSGLFFMVLSVIIIYRNKFISLRISN